MHRIPTLFLRYNELPTISEPLDGPIPVVEGHHVSDQVRPGCEWVLEGKGIATRKWDGLCCLVKDGRLWKRIIVKDGEYCPIDPSVEWVSYDDGIVWLPVGDGPEDKLYRDAWQRLKRKQGVQRRGFCPPVAKPPPGGTYELVECLDRHVLVRHGEDRWCQDEYEHELNSFEAVKKVVDYLNWWEGIVWWHKDDEDKPYHERRLAQVTRKDFGLGMACKEQQ